MFSFFVPVVLLDAGLFLGGNTTLINRSKDLQMEVG